MADTSTLRGRHHWRRVFRAAAVIVMLGAGAACSAETLTESAIERTIEEVAERQGEGDLDIDFDFNSDGDDDVIMSIESDDGSSIVMQENDLPASWPGWLALPDDVDDLFAQEFTAADGDGSMSSTLVGFATDRSVDEMFERFSSGFVADGWTELTRTDATTDGQRTRFASFQQPDNPNASGSVTAVEEDGRTSVVLNLTR